MIRKKAVEWILKFALVLIGILIDLVTRTTSREEKEG